ncbi:MAG TPA: pirin family protein [Candidatus Pelethocola excrementipullorum]|nr:pirin family protein [Candidatus Pelethocola excrementipullorum]
MSIREIKKTVRGQRAVDGAGVNLVRVLGRSDVYDFDPFLMLDAFDSTDPEDYIKGFPMHPHRGIETVTYLIKGEFEHEDSLKNVGHLRDGECQWMTSGSGILHQEMPKPADRMLGVQLWVNLPKEDKMTAPRYSDISKDMIPVVDEEDAVVRIISGDYKDKAKGVDPAFVKATLYDVTVKPGKTVTIDTKEEDNVFIFLIEGDGLVGDHSISEKTAVLFGEGSSIQVSAKEREVRFIYFGGKPLNEPIAWAGPIVMNTKEELSEAFSELEQGSFIKHD